MTTSNQYIIGFVETENDAIPWVNIQKISAYTGNEISQLETESEWFPLQDVEKLGMTLNKEDFETMINLAIMTKDKNWFNQLTERMLKDA
ncbi:hypothetical protein AWH48_16365 [Domibacillus aminovorans]|uniref:IDEAL domain-containing protein n=1 Tax=Domibacillus aminovorans TaxID=29332 RepID=A0A177L322_9BACI|nr:hypothetical protein [Domibacillus aminovorans]OAH59161.1 hypothetical protein AWH48_16365 [Domibacillus aminovorans]